MGGKLDPRSGAQGATPTKVNQMATEKFGLHLEAGQKDDGTWSFFRVDPATHEIEQTIAAAWIDIQADAIDVEMEVLDTPPIPGPTKRADGGITTWRPWDIGSVRLLVSDLVLYDFLYPELQGKTFARLTFREKSSGSVIKEFKDVTY